MAEDAPSPDPGPPVRRSLWLYRLAVLALLGMIAALVVAFNRRMEAEQPPARPTSAVGTDQVVVYDLEARFGWVEAHKRSWTDISETFYSSPAASVHMHTMGLGQICPLHLHRSGEEATVIVTGSAEVSFVFGERGAVTKRAGLYPPGSVLGSPAGCGHRWKNPDQERMLGNLVIAAPTFYGNLYVEPDDPRLREGKAPVVFRPEEQLRSFTGSNEELRVKRLPIMGGRLAVVMVAAARQLAIPPAGKEPSVAYVLSGSGALDSPRGKPARSHAIRSKHLVLMRNRTQLRVRVGSSGPLVLLLFRPEEAWADPWPAT